MRIYNNFLLLLFLFNACGYTQLKFKLPTTTEADQVSDTYIEKKKEHRDFLFSPTIGNFNTQPYRIYDNYRYPYINYGYSYYNSPDGAYQIYEQNLKINQLIQELDQYKRIKIMQNVQKTSSPSSVIEKEKQKAVWKLRINPRHRKKVRATRRELEKADASD